MKRGLSQRERVITDEKKGYYKQNELLCYYEEKKERVLI